MKEIKRRIRSKPILPLLIISLVLFFSKTFSQSDSSEDSRSNITLRLSYSQYEDTYEIVAKVTARIDRRRQPVKGISLEVYNAGDTSEVFIGNMETDENGEAIIGFSRSESYFKNEEGAKVFLVRFDGNDKYLSESKEIEIRDAMVKLNFVEIDSVKTIVAKAWEYGADGDEIPIEGEDMYFYVQGSFSLLNLGDEELDDGQCQVDFPVTLPGDSVGNVNIVARIEESRDYGTVEVRSAKDWGVPRIPVQVENRRGLGDTDAPLWMVYTLIVLLSVVWFHYIYILFVVHLIKKDGKKASPNI